MRARDLVEGASFDPATIKIMVDAFDSAWTSIAHKYQDVPKRTEAARLALAKAVLSVASETSTDAEALKTGALQAMAMDYRVGTDGASPSLDVTTETPPGDSRD
ncbi:MAG: hypothetical protein AB7L90_21200 [Hyphomicrobiaceae bacterium]